MLQKVLQHINSAQGAFSLASLSRELDVEPSALEGMIQTLIQQGKLNLEDDLCVKCLSAPTTKKDSGCCSTYCSGTGCPFASASSPRRFVLPRH